MELAIEIKHKNLINKIDKAIEKALLLIKLR
jgi:hypothetical protein